MTSIVPREKVDSVSIHYPPQYSGNSKTIAIPGFREDYGTSVSKLWRSQGNPINRKTGKYESGGAFHVTHSGAFISPGQISNAYTTGTRRYSGPCMGAFAGSALKEAHYSGKTSDKDPKDLDPDGATAIALCAPNNPTANLSTSLGESMREGIPTLPGIQLWKRKTQALKSLGSEYLGYQFGWKPLVDEVNNVVNSARHHRDIMQNYRNGEGTNRHRRFDFATETQQWEEENSPANATNWAGGKLYQSGLAPAAQRVSYVRYERKRWFEGCFTYGGPSGTDSFRRHLGFGSEADAVYGLNLSPDVLWELTPWSWAVDWFTNAGDVIHNVSNFAAAGLVMRYGYMMEETINEAYTQYGDSAWRSRLNNDPSGQETVTKSGACKIGFRTVTKTRAPANPFGFGVGWEGLSPTQLAITAAIGITRFL